MAAGRLHDLVRYLRRSVAPDEAAGSADADLLARYVQRQDESAFELLVWRHAQTVLGACRRVLRDEHTAEDCFQATFLALARQARSIGRRESVGGWLYKVAYRIALKAKARAVRRGGREEPLDNLAVPAGQPLPDDLAAGRELLAVLDEQVARLPRKYREAFVLRCLAGKDEPTARELGCPVGTVESRLTRRASGCAALTRRGFTVPAGLLAGALIHSPAQAALVRSTAKAAFAFAAGKATVAGAASPQVVALTTEALNGMFMTKAKVVTAVLFVVLVVGTGAGRLAYPTAAAGPDGPGKPKVVSETEKLRRENEELKRKLATALEQAAMQADEAKARLQETAVMQRRFEQERAALEKRFREQSAAVADIERALGVLKGTKGRPADGGSVMLGRAALLDKARAELHDITALAEEMDRRFTAKVVEARQLLVELEERLREVEGEVPGRALADENKLRGAEVARLETAMQKFESILDRGKSHPEVVALRKQLDEARNRRQAAEKRMVQAREEWSRHRIDLRQQMVRLEEDIRVLERKRAANREEMERRREKAAERLRQLEEGPYLGGASSPLHGVERRLDAMQRELSELRREVQELRPKRKR